MPLICHRAAALHPDAVTARSSAGKKHRSLKIWEMGTRWHVTMYETTERAFVYMKGLCGRLSDKKGGS